MKFNDDLIEELNQLSDLNNYRGIIAVASDWIVIFAIIVLSLYFDNVLLYILAVVIIGTRQRALATILHESAHRVLAKNTKINDVLGKYFSGYFIFQTFQKYAKSHVILHHNYLGKKNKDPDYDYYIESNLFEEATKRRFVKKHLILPLFFSKTPSFVNYLLKNRLGDYKDPEFKKSSYVMDCYICRVFLYEYISSVNTVLVCSTYYNIPNGRMVY